MRSAALVVLLTVLAAQGLRAQSQCVAPRITSPAQLRATLDSIPGAADAEPRAAAIATLGTPVVGWALDIAKDSALPGGTRAAALRVLGYARWKPAMGDLVRLARPFQESWVVWRGALSALTTYPYAELTPIWLDLIRFPRRVVREDALRGLSTTADEKVLPMVREATSHEEDPAVRDMIAGIEARLRRPLAERDTARFAWPPDSLGGRYTPPLGRGCTRADFPY